MITKMPETEQEIAKYSQAAYQQVLANLKKGLPPQEAIKRALSDYSEQVLGVMAGAFSSILERSIGSTTMGNYQVGNLKLSQMLYKNSKDVAAGATHVINNHLKGFVDLKKLTLQLFEGYREQGYGKTDVLRIPDPLPKYLKRLLGDSYKEADLIYARAQADALVSPALKASYLDLIKGLELGKGQKYLEQKLRTAVYEKSRYLSQRIATTEVTRAYNKKLVTQINEDTEYIQIKPSGNHVPDRCDVFFQVDPLGLGAGVYKKGEAPVPPYHVRCKCVVHERLDLQGAKGKDNKHAARDYFENLEEAEQKRLVPNERQREELLDGQNPMAVFNKGVNEAFKIPKIEDLL
jgi:hypothetical protein